MELIDSANQEVKQVAVRAAETGGRFSIKAIVHVIKSGSAALVNGMNEMLSAAREMLNEQRTTGKISTREFGRSLTGAREVVDISDKAVVKELESNLKRYGCTFAVEQGDGGVYTLHIQGKDVKVVEHALSVAAQRVDQKISRNATRRKNGEKIKAGVEATKEQRVQKKLARTAQPAQDKSNVDDGAKKLPTPPTR